MAASLVCAECLTPLSSFAGWTNIYTCRVGGNGIARGAWSAFFFNEFVGFVGTSGDAGIFKTTDGGKTWIIGKIPSGYAGNITDIFMADSLQGWATVEDPRAAPCIWSTIDGGLTWSPVGLNGNYSSLYKTPSALIVTSRSNGGSNALRSIDGGTTFQTYPILNTTNGIDFTDDIHGVITGFHAVPWKITADGGLNWNVITPQITTESWSVFAVKGTSVFFACPEQYPGTRPVPGVSSILRSTDYGSTWSNIGPLTFYSTGTIKGAAGVLYVQADSDRIVNKNISGLYRSTDNGITWVSVGGPSNSLDTRFAVTGCSGGIVYAFDGFGNVWKTRDGGDGAIAEPPIELTITGDPVTLEGRICSTTIATATLLNKYCIDDTVLSISIVNPTSDLFASGALKLTAPVAFPFPLLPNQEQSLSFLWDPSILFHSDTSLTTQIRIRYYSKVLQRITDTVINLIVHAVGDPPSVKMSPTVLQYGSIDFCKQYDTVISLTNLGCDTLILKGYSTGTPDITVTDLSGNPLTFPIRLLPNQKTDIKVSLSLTTAGPFQHSLSFHLRHQGIDKDTSISLAGFIDGTASFAVADSLVTGIVSTCNPLDTSIVFKNFGCTDIIIDSIGLFPSGAFTLNSAIPASVKPGDSAKISINFSPTFSGTFDDTLIVVFRSLGESHRIRIPIHGTGSRLAALLSTNIPFDTLFSLNLTVCDSPRIYPIILSNPGCDSLTIISVVQTPVSSGVTINYGQLPKALYSTQSLTSTLPITVKALTDQIGTFDGNIRIRYQLKDGSIKDTTILYFLSVKHGAKILSLSQDTIDLGTMKFCDEATAMIMIKSPGCDSLHTTIQLQSIDPGLILKAPPSKTNFAQNDSTRISIQFDPTITGTHEYGRITIGSDADSAANRSIPIIATVLPTDTLIFSISSSRPTFYPGDTVSLFITPQLSTAGRNLRDISFTVNYNSDLMTLLPDKTQVFVPNSTYIFGGATGDAKHTQSRIFWQGLPYLEMPANTPALKLVFVARLTDTLNTNISISDISLNGGDAVYSKCSLGIVSMDASYSISLRCGDSLIVKLLREGSENYTLRTLPVIPDPITDPAVEEVTIPVSVNEVGLIKVELFDGLGSKVITKEMGIGSKGVYRISAPIKGLPNGRYTMILRHLSNGASAQNSFIIAK